MWHNVFARFKTLKAVVKRVVSAIMYKRLML